MTDDPKRLKPELDTIRRLFATSGNLCAFPNCSRLMIRADGKYIGKICHIEGVRGERFRATMDNEDRRAFGNLMLMCDEHHTDTDDESVYTVDVLRRMKRDHEARFTDAAIRIYEAFEDLPAKRRGTRVRTAERFSRVLGWNHGVAELTETADEINRFVERLAKMDIPTRRFLEAVVTKAHDLKGTANVDQDRGKLLVRWSAVAQAFGRTDEAIMAHVESLMAFGVGGHETMEIDDVRTDAIVLDPLPDSGWNLWPDLAQFCDLMGESLTPYIQDLDFSRLDETDQVARISAAFLSAAKS